MKVIKKEGVSSNGGPRRGTKKYVEWNGFIHALLSLRGLIFIYFLDERGKNIGKGNSLAGVTGYIQCFKPLVTAHHTCSRIVTHPNIRFLDHGNSKK